MRDAPTLFGLQTSAPIVALVFAILSPVYFINLGRSSLLAVSPAGVLEPSFDLSLENDQGPVISHLRRAFLAAAVLGVPLALSPVIILPEINPDISSVLHYAPSVIFISVCAALGWNSLRGGVARCFADSAVPLLTAYMLFCIAFVPVIESSRPVKEICRNIRAVAGSGDDAGYFKANLPSMAFYTPPIFEEYDGDAMVRRFQSGKRVFCVLNEKEYDYFVGSRDLILYVLDRHPVFSSRVLLSDTDTACQELLLASNMPYSETEAYEGRKTP